MAHYRVGRLEQEIQREVNDILLKRVRDPRVQDIEYVSGLPSLSSLDVGRRKSPGKTGLGPDLSCFLGSSYQEILSYSVIVGFPIRRCLMGAFKPGWHWGQADPPFVRQLQDALLAVSWCESTHFARCEMLPPVFIVFDKVR